MTGTPDTDTKAAPPPPGRPSPGSALWRLARAAGPDGLLALVLFASLATLSWRRWASFAGDLNREWTTPARVAAGERLYRDVSWYYGPLAPWAEGAVFRLLGARVGTAVAVELATAAGALALVLAASRRFLPPAGRVALAATAVGVVAFSPRNGALVAAYSQSALWAVGFSWGAFLLAGRGKTGGAALSAAAALLSKFEALPALVAAAAAAPVPARRRALLAGTAVVLAAAGYAVACAGIPLDELVRYGPLRHFRMPPEFRELYLRVSGLHPDLLARGAAGAAAGALLAAGWLLGAGGLLAARPGRAALGGALLAGGLGLRAAGPLALESVPGTLFRSLPILAGGAFVLALRIALDGRRPAEERAAARQAAAAAAIGLSFSWRSFLWMVPAYPYAPLAALSCLPAAAWLATVPAPSGIGGDPGRRTRAAWLLALPLVVSPLFFLPGLVAFYRSPRTEVVAPRGRWVPPGEEGPLFSRLVAVLSPRGLADGQLVVLPEASALNFLLGVRSPLRLEQVLPGHLDDAADEDAARLFRSAPPEFVVLVPRTTPEYGGLRLGKDYGTKLMGEISRLYAVEERIPFASEAGSPATALVLRRRLP